MKIIQSSGEKKKEEFLRLLELGTVMVFLDSRSPDVSVPEEHKGKVQLALNFDYAFRINDFRITDDQIEATLTFNQMFFFCEIPFHAVYMMRSLAVDEMVVFPEFFPLELMTLEKEAKEVKQPTPKPASKLSVIEGEQMGDAENKPLPEKTPKKKNHLKLVE